MTTDRYVPTLDGWRAMAIIAVMVGHAMPVLGWGRLGVDLFFAIGASRGKDLTGAFARAYAAEPDVLVEQLKKDEAIAEADTLLLTVPNQLGVDYNAHVIESILKHVAPGMGWR